SEADLASSLRFGPGDAFPPVLATARMVALMEVAAARVLAPFLGPGELSVGVRVEVTHSRGPRGGFRSRRPPAIWDAKTGSMRSRWSLATSGARSAVRRIGGGSFRASPPSPGAPPPTKPP